MACKIKKRTSVHRNLITLRRLINSKSVEPSSIINDVIFYISALKLKREALERQKANLLNQSHILPQEQQQVTIEKVENGFIVKARSEKKGEENHLVTILEAFEELNLVVLDAKVTSDDKFEMEAYVGVDCDRIMEEKQRNMVMDVEVVKEAVLSAFKKISLDIDGRLGMYDSKIGS